MDPAVAFLIGLLSGIAQAYLFLLAYREEARAAHVTVPAWSAEEIETEIQRHLAAVQAAEAAAIQAEYQASAAEYARQVNTVEEMPW